MQTKKRAKSVKFGKPRTDDSKKQKSGAETTVGAVKSTHYEEEDVVVRGKQATKETKIPTIPDEEDIDTSKEIKQKIEEKIHPKEDAEELAGSNGPGEDISVKPELEEKKTEFGSFINEDYEKPKKKGGNLLFFFIVVIITFLIGLLLIGGFYYLSNNKLPNFSVSIKPPAPTPPPANTPTPTEKPVDLSVYEIKVLNGSGKTGEAAKVKSLLSDAGFKVVDIGNADASDYTKTVISAKTEVSTEFLEKLTEILAKSYSVEEKTEKLSETDTSDVIITIGSSIY